MTQGTFTIQIDKEVTEQKIVEDFLNHYYSGYDFFIPLSFYALAKSWKIQKLAYYMNLKK